MILELLLHGIVSGITGIVENVQTDLADDKLRRQPSDTGIYHDSHGSIRSKKTNNRCYRWTDENGDDVFMEFGTNVVAWNVSAAKREKEIAKYYMQPHYKFEELLYLAKEYDKTARENNQKTGDKLYDTVTKRTVLLRVNKDKILKTSIYFLIDYETGEYIRTFKNESGKLVPGGEARIVEKSIDRWRKICGQYLNVMNF